MSDAKDNSREQQGDSETQSPQGGERLAEARRAQKISVLEIAKELHLDEPKVRALERNEFDVLGAPVFAKGHLRKYARLVKVGEDDVMADYYLLNRAASMPQVVSGRPRPRREMSPGPWIAVIVIIVLVATAYWWFTTDSYRADEPTQDSLPEETLRSQQPLAEQPVTDDSDVVAPQTPAVDDGEFYVLQPEAADSEVAVPAADADDAPDLDDGQMRLLVTYSGDCWTEITDALGRRLFFGLGTDGRTVELSGAAPFNVLFGNAENVRLQVNGVERAITASERRGRIARLTLTDS